MTAPKNILNPSFDDPVYSHKVAVLKRVIDMWYQDAAFHRALEENPEQAIADCGLDADPEAVRLLIHADACRQADQEIKAGRMTVQELPETFVYYQHFTAEKLAARNQLRHQLCHPIEPRFLDWRARQDKRCMLEFGPASLAMVHSPVVFELSDGCSVGCPFCGLAAHGLKGVFRHTEENAALWRDVLRRVHLLVGEAAGQGICYYASEGLDNPDYEQFLMDYYQEFGTVPQTTTAASTRDIERTKSLIRKGQALYPHIDRFSVLSPAMSKTIFEAFTPEELLRVELLPQFPEAPGCRLTKAGRNREEGSEEIGNTIACISGFIINMKRMTVRLSTPFVTDKAHPTGEWTLEQRTFTSAEELEAALRQMIARHMPQTLRLKEPCAAVCDFRLKMQDSHVWLFGHGMGMRLVNAPLSQEELDTLQALLKEGGRTGYELVEQTAEHVYVILPAEATKEQEEAIAAQLKQRFQAQNGAPFEGKLEVVRNTKEDIYLPFTPAPKAQELSDEMVDQAAGGTNEHSKEFFFTVVDVVVLQNINVEAATVVYDMPVQVIGPSYPAVISAYSPDPVYITDPSKLPPAYVSAICQVM